jgi:signal transduction histidine kinase
LLATEIHFPDDLKKLIARQAEIGDTIEIIYTDNVDWEEVEEIVKWNIYRVLQQLFNNIHRHAEASLVCVKLYTDESNQLILSLIEDGIGFELDKEFETANGLNNIQLRVDSCGGNIDIKSNINSGTEIFISLPKSIKKENYDKQVFGPNH